MVPVCCGLKPIGKVRCNSMKTGNRAKQRKKSLTCVVLFQFKTVSPLIQIFCKWTVTHRCGIDRLRKTMSGGGKFENGGETFAERADQSQRTAMQLGQGFHKRQSKPGAFRGTVSAGLLKG